MPQRDWNFLKILTKDQIIDFLKRENWMNAPEERRVKFFKWNVVGDKLLEELQKNTDNFIKFRKINKKMEINDKLLEEVKAETEEVKAANENKIQ